jgi:hypothetical protein
VLAQFGNYDELITALRARAAELNVTGPELDRVSGLPDKYAQKLLGPGQIRRLGAISLGCFLGALAVRGLLVEDKAAVERLRSRTRPRNQSYVRSTPSIIFTVRFFQRIGRLGAQARIDNSTKQQRQQWARHAAFARWRKP